MTRINTNVSSLVAQNTLGRSHADLEQALTRLSTGLRINSGKDDPAGLIASESLRSDITSIKQAISNTDRANQVIATADSALGQVSGLLNDIRGLVTEAANGGASGPDQIKANQLQIDSSLKALNRIAQTVTFQGRKLLDGSLDFITSGGTNFSKLSGLQIDQANLGATGSASVNVNVTAAATNAEVDIAVPAATAPTNANANLTLSNAAAQAVFHFDFDTTPSVGVTVTALNGGAAQGASGNGITVVVNDTNDSSGAVSNVSYASGTLTIDADLTGGVTNTDIATAIQASNSGADFTAVATGTAATALAAGDANVGYTPTYSTNGRDAGSTVVSVSADAAGVTANGVTVTLTEDNSIANNTASAAITGGNIAVKVHGTVTKQAIIDAINGLNGYSATATSATGDANYIQTSDTPPGVATLGGGVAASGGLTQDAVFELSGLSGSEVFTIGAGTSITDLAAAINLQKDATGVQATVSGTTLQLTSTAYGTAAFVDIKPVTEASGGTITAAVGQGGTRNTGTDVVATVNGITANGDGNTLSVNTSTLDLKTTVEAAFTGSVDFDITGGGALFQLGPDVVSNQQARIGITSVNTARLGGVSGKLYQLGQGGTADLSTSPTLAGSIIDEAINQVTSLRGRLGAFQRTSLETNKNTLTDTLTTLTQAESQIRDADFASETAALTRAQILVQSGTTVLQIANSNPQNVLALLRQ
jgi:flagellin